MLKEVALVTVSAVLFVQMGLSSAIQQVLRFRSKIASCPKCVTFWSVLACCLLTGNGVIVSVAASFISSYVALWLALIYDAMAMLYNSIYDSITKTTGPSSDAEADTGEPAPDSGTDEVPQM